MKKIYFLFLFGICSVLQASAGFEFTNNLSNAYQNIIRLKLDEGKRLLDVEAKENPSNTLRLLYENYIDFLKAFITEEKKYSDSLRLNAERRLRKIEHEDESSPYFLFSKAEILLQNAVIKIKLRENVSAALDIRKSYKLIERNSILHPTFILNKKLCGLLHTMVGAVPDEFKWLVRLAGMDGTITQGTSELNGLFSEIQGGAFSVYKEEILFFQSRIATTISLDDKTPLALMGALKSTCAQSPLMTYCYVTLAMRAGKNDDALEVINQKNEWAGSFPFYFLSYKKGLLRMHKLDMNASEDFREYISNFKGGNYIRSSYQKLGWIALMKGDTNMYRAYMDSCLHFANSLADDDKEAMSEAERRELPDVTLLRTRLLFDGGYYDQALKEITKIISTSSLSFRDQIEYTYRCARIFHKNGHTEKAIDFYSQTVANGERQSFYFAANSALLLGNIFEEKNNFPKAEEYYQRCLSMRQHDYQNSIDQKAEAGLERVKQKK